MYRENNGQQYYIIFVSKINFEYRCNIIIYLLLSQSCYFYASKDITHIFIS